MREENPPCKIAPEARASNERYRAAHNQTSCAIDEGEALGKCVRAFHLSSKHASTASQQDYAYVAEPNVTMPDGNDIVALN